MADAVSEGTENPPAVRFFCHKCNIEFEDILQDYTCPYCASGFIERLETGAERVHGPGHGHRHGNGFHGARLSPFDVTLLHPYSINHRTLYPTTAVPPLLQDIAFLMSGGPGRSGNGGPPVVLVGAPGDYVFGGEALDAVVTQLLGQLEHSGPPPMPRDIMNTIPNESVTAQQAGTSCSVCWDNFELGETISRLVCDHVFHKTCITPWLQLHATCPICRRSLMPQRPSDQEESQSTGSTTSAATASTDGERPRPIISPRVVIRRSNHPLFRRGFHTHIWNSPRDMSTSSGSSSSVTTGGRWAPRSSSDTASNSSTSANDRTQNYHTDFECD